MKKNWFAIVIFLYAGLTVLDAGLFSANAYIDQATWNDYFKAHVLIRLIVAVVTGILLFKAYKRFMPEVYNKRKDKVLFRIFLPVLLLLATFIMNTLIILPLNDINRPADKKITIDGVVSGKYMRSGGKGGRNYFLVITDKRYHQYNLQVKKYIYQEYNRDSAFDKTMTEGMLGIIYRKEE